ncbi:hypothetical protein ABDB91_07440 [Desulfoscipio sp. XC116]|uniref:hypothetical protein n=1 Tax=Desulfoscipio sp. XC116 TaxID=3144975 RepID=UPI00325BF8CF
MKLATKKIFNKTLLIFLLSFLLVATSLMPAFAATNVVNTSIPVDSVATNDVNTSVPGDKTEIQAVPAVYVIATVLTSARPVIQRILASPATRKAGDFLKFSYKNFRKNLITLTRGNPGTKYEAHHLLPKAHESRFAKAHIRDIHNPKYGTWVDKTYHRKTANEFNNHWEYFFKRYEDKGKFPTKSEVLKYAKTLCDKYKFHPNF